MFDIGIRFYVEIKHNFRGQNLQIELSSGDGVMFNIKGTQLVDPQLTKMVDPLKTLPKPAVLKKICHFSSVSSARQIKYERQQRHLNSESVVMEITGISGVTQKARPGFMAEAWRSRLKKAGLPVHTTLRCANTS